MLIQQKEDEKKAIEEASRPEGAQDIMQIPIPGQGPVGSTDADKAGLTKLGLNSENRQKNKKDAPPMPGISPEKYGIDPSRLAQMGPIRSSARKTSKEKK